MTIDSSVEKLIRRIFYTLFKWKWFIAIVFCITVVLMLFMTILVTPTYRAANRVLVSHNYKQQVSLFSEVVTPGQLNTRVNYNNNFLNILQSEMIADTIVSEFKLDERLQQKVENPENFRDVAKRGIINAILFPKNFAVSKGWLGTQPKDWRAEAIEAFIKDAQDVMIVEDTEIIEIAVYESSPELANAIVDRMTELLIERLLELNRSEANLAYEYALSQSKEVEQEYIRSRDALERMKQDLRVASFDDEKRLLVEHKENLEEQLTSNAAERAELQSKIEESERQSEDDRLLPTKKNEILSRMSDLRVELAGTAGRGRTIEENLDKIIEQIDAIIVKENKYTALLNDVALSERTYFQLREKIQELSIQQGTNTGEFGLDVVDRNPVSEHASPDSPDLMLFLPLILIFAAGISVGLPFIVEFFRDYPSGQRELEELTEAPVWGAVSKSRRLGRLSV